MSSVRTIPPPITWAQRFHCLYLIIDVECKDIDYKVTESTFSFKGVNANDANVHYDVTLNFLNSVDPDSVTSKNIGRCYEFTIVKKVEGPYWKSLTNDKTKLHFLNTNFLKWKNESDDEEDDEEDSKDAMKVSPDMFKSGFNFNKLDDFNIEEDDSDDNIPSLSNNDDDNENQDSDDESETEDKDKAATDEEKKKKEKEDKQKEQPMDD